MFFYKTRNLAFVLFYYVVVLCCCTQVSKADVELIAHELELDNSKADRLLRIHNNDIAAAIKAYIS